MLHPLIELGTNLLPGMCAAALFHPLCTFISLGEHFRSKASCLPDIFDLLRLCLCKKNLSNNFKNAYV